MSRTSTSVFRGGLWEGVTSKSVAGNSNVTLTTEEAKNRVLKFTGLLTGSIGVTLPVTSEDDGLRWTIRNATTGAFRLTVLNPSGTPLDIPQGTNCDVEFNGTQFALANTSAKPARASRKYVYADFRHVPLAAKFGGAGAVTGTAGDRNVMQFPNGSAFEYHIKGTQTIVCPVLTSVGLDIGMDQTSADGVELTNGITSRCPVAFVVGTDGAFQFSVKVKLEDASGANPLVIGFRKAEAYQATVAAYADYAYIGIIGTANPNTIQLTTEAAGGGATTTDTTNTWADTATKTLTVKVSSAGVVTYQIDGAAPTTVAAFSFTAADVVVPSLFFLNAADVAGTVEVIEWECGLQADLA